jgi:hypothetical protein
MSAPCWTVTLLALSLFSAAEARANPPAAISGPMRCGINDYGWPSSADSAPIVAGGGTLEIMSDGHGNYTSGQMTEHLPDDTRMAGTNVCTFDLESGTYVQLPDRSTANTMGWKLRSGSDSHCGAVVTHEKYLGFTEGARAFRAFTTKSTSYVLEDGRIAWARSSDQGVAMGICEPIKK